LPVGLKIPWGKPCAGSSPAVRTNKIKHLLAFCMERILRL
jgi:hypothetical protein